MAYIGPLGYRTWNRVSPIQGGSESWLEAGEVRPYLAVLNPEPFTIVADAPTESGLFDLLADTPATFERLQEACATFDRLVVA